jgi:multiple sugar transport system substrate-binding protein
VPASQGATTPGNGEKVTLSFWNHINSPSNTYEKKLIDEYQSQNPNVTINYLTVTDVDMQPKLTTAMAGGSGPDIVNIGESFLPQFVAHGDVAPVDFAALGLDGQAAFNANYSPSIVAGYTFNGATYGVPYEVSSGSFWVNGAEFQKAGLDPVADFPKTYTDLVRVGQKIQATSAAREGLALTLYKPGQALENLDAMARQAGGSLMSADGKTPQLDSPAAIKALQMWSDLVRVDKINDPSLGPTASTNAEDLFGNGTAAMVNTAASWFIGVLQAQYPDVYKNYVVGQWPIFPGGPMVGPDYDGYALFVNKASAHQAEAWKFAKFLTDHATDYFQNTGIWLGDTATLSSSAAAAFPHWDVFRQSAADDHWFPPVVKFNELSQIVSVAVQQAVLNGETPQAALSQAQQQAVTLLK